MIDYTKVKFEDHVKNVDAVIDTVGEDTAERAMTTLKKGRHVHQRWRSRTREQVCRGRVSNAWAAPPRRDVARSVYEEVSRSAAQRQTQGEGRPGRFRWTEASKAHAYGEEGHTQGKIVLIVDAANANRR